MRGWWSVQGFARGFGNRHATDKSSRSRAFAGADGAVSLPASVDLPGMRALLAVVSFLAAMAPSLALRVAPPTTLSAPRTVHSRLALQARVGQMPPMMRDGDDSEGGFASYLGSSAEAWAKTAKERPAFFALRIIILGSGLSFFATIAGALVQRVL